MSIMRMDPLPGCQFEPKVITEIFIQLNADGNIFYQFSGLDGGHADPQQVYQLLAMMANTVARGTTTQVVQSPIQGVTCENVTQQSPLYPHETEAPLA